MARGSGVTLLEGPQPLSTGLARTRFIIALGFSALLHLSLASVMSGGSVGVPRPSAPQSGLTVRMVDVATPVPAPAVAISAEPVSIPERRPQRGVSKAAPAAIAADARPVDRPIGSGAAVEGPDPTYYAAKQLDVYPALSSALDLRSTDKPASPGALGRALLLVLIDEVGVVKEVSVVEGEPAGHFEEARGAFMSARFTPAYRNGRPVKSRVLVEINYGEERAAR